MSLQSIVVIGASHAGAQCVISLRQGGYEGKITLIGDEAECVYENANVDLKLSTRVEKINRALKTVSTDKGETIPYDRLVLATGARVRKLRKQLNARSLSAVAILD